MIKPAADNNANDVDVVEGASWAELAGKVIVAGPFAAYTKFTDLPRAMRVAPDATTWAAVELWR